MSLGTYPASEAAPAASVVIPVAEEEVEISEAEGVDAPLGRIPVRLPFGGDGDEVEKEVHFLPRRPAYRRSRPLSRQPVSLTCLRLNRVPTRPVRLERLALGVADGAALALDEAVAADLDLNRREVAVGHDGAATATSNCCSVARPARVPLPGATRRTRQRWPPPSTSHAPTPPPRSASTTAARRTRSPLSGTRASITSSGLFIAWFLTFRTPYE